MARVAFALYNRSYNLVDELCMYTQPPTHHVSTQDHLHTTYVHTTTYTPLMYTLPPTHHVCTHGCQWAAKG